jgi:two-component system, response regulator / RNA-binding antiterminator
MNILIIDPNPERAKLVEAGLRADLQNKDAIIQYWPQFEIMRVKDINPEIVIIACESPDRDTLDALQIANEVIPRPIVMFVDRSDDNTTAHALEAGVAAYVVDGYSPNRISSILKVATQRFKQTQALKANLDKAKADLAARKLIDKAKGILMRSRNISEDEAYKMMRKHAMDKAKPMASIAQDILAIANLLNPNED